MNPDLKQLQEEIEELKAKLKTFESLAQLDPQIIRTISSSVVKTSSKSATSANQVVNEAGVASYSVLNPPDRFIKIGIYNVPAWDS